jgi:hypothetical protein
MSDSIKDSMNWKEKWKSKWKENTLDLSDTVIALNCTPYLQQTQTYKNKRLEYYRFSVPDTYIEHGILIPERTYKILIREIIAIKQNPTPAPEKIQDKWKRKWVQNWEEYKYKLGDTIHSLIESMTIAQTKKIQGKDKKIFWKFTIPRDYTKHGLINPDREYRLLIREVYK